MTVEDMSLPPIQLTTLSFTGLSSEITYEFITSSDNDGCTVPALLGRGGFAKVYKAYQCSAGHNVRPVAIKILHENIDKKGEQLFHLEIGIMKKLTSSAGINVVKILDILQLGPLLMCGNCGQTYHPRCPECGIHPLERYDPPHEAFAALRCKGHPRCKYMVSGETVINNCAALMRSPSKACCAGERSERAQRSTLINFVDRDAVVMELMDEKLPRFNRRRQRAYFDLCSQHGVLLPSPFGDHLRSSLEDPTPMTSALRPATTEEVEMVSKVVLLEKILLMMQLAETMAWLHGAQEIIHKDVAPDNAMVVMASEEESDLAPDWRGQAEGTLQDALTSRITYQSFKATLIDFGLSDHKQLKPNYYEEPAAKFAIDKLPYMSLEARNRKRRLNERLDLDPGRRQFLIPDNLRPDKAGELAIQVGDLLVDESDPNRHYSLEVTGIEQDVIDRRIFRATVSGEIPPYAIGRQFELVMRLGEAHDIYSMGAVFFFILTGDHNHVTKLTNLAHVLQDATPPLQAEVLSSNDNYRLCRELLPEQYYQDELMILILRAMVRGQEESFVEKRTQRGPEPAQRLLIATQRIYNQLKAELLTSHDSRALATTNTALAQRNAVLENERIALHRNKREDDHARAVQGEQLKQLAASHAILEGQLTESMSASQKRQRLLLSLVMVVGMVGVGLGSAIQSGKLPFSLPGFGRLAALEASTTGR